MPLSTDTTRIGNVIEATLNIASQLFPKSPPHYVSRIFKEVEILFTGGYLDYAANDLKYHDLRHTLQVTIAYVDIIAARQHAVTTPVTFRQFELGLTAALFHDSGYLKLRSDKRGTGAKYTYCHVLRGCALASSYLPSLGLSTEEIEIVLGIIRNTGPSTNGMRLRFNSKHEQTLACAVATADYLGQMAAADYPDELELLFNEFSESDDFSGVPLDCRTFQTAAGLISSTPAFWIQVVRPKLEKDFMGLYRFLNTPDGTNPYVDAIENNMRTIALRTASITA
ncbi:MAG TPA: hypothetical protein VL357_01270 [Rariglobus sp.]|jgi:hypothetical protein|nr:hypothetical protein [Rariglobus sp.]